MNEEQKRLLEEVRESIPSGKYRIVCDETNNTPEDGNFTRSNITEDYFQKLRKAYFVAKEMGFPTRNPDGVVNLEDYFEENLKNLKETEPNMARGENGDET
jgi:hypothetical protein